MGATMMEVPVAALPSPSSMYWAFLVGQRQRIAKELVETERKYCSCLWTVFDTFAEPLKQSGLVSAKDARYVGVVML